MAGALACAEGSLAGLRGVSAERDAALQDVVALIAYQQPEQSPLAALLAPARREATADVVNSAVLRAGAPAGAPEPQAALEACLQQLVAVQVGAARVGARRRKAYCCHPAALAGLPPVAHSSLSCSASELLDLRPSHSPACPSAHKLLPPPLPPLHR